VSRAPARIARREVQLLCGLVVFLNAFVWALVTPSFHVPDEPQHVAYVQYLAETGRLPRPIDGAVFAQEEAVAFAGVGFNAVVGNVDGKPPWTSQHDARLEHELAQDLNRKSDGAFSNTTNNPPLYYLVEAVPYKLFGGADFWTRLLAMRIVSAVLIALTALVVFAFLRELLPGRPVAWTAGALSAGLTPLVGFVGSGVNNDAGLALAGALTVYALARAFRRGLDARSGLLVGTVYGLGLMTKVTLVGFIPGLLLAGGVLVARQWRGSRRHALRGLAAAAAAIALPATLYLLAIDTFWDRPLWTGGIALSGTGEGAGGGSPASFREMLSYIWLFYLPRVPGQIYDPGGYGVWDTWFTGWIGRFGWLDYGFSSWVYDVAGYLWLALLLLIGWALWRFRSAVRGRLGELGTYVALVAGVALVANIQGYRYRVDTGGLIFEQTRYLLPVLALYGAAVAVAVVGVGRRASGAVATAIVALTLVHGMGALIVTLVRYYA
jgi:4-amino-4-deoxy-L-arabinose transferase-like glycosyltransferase